MIRIGEKTSSLLKGGLLSTGKAKQKSKRWMPIQNIPNLSLILFFGTLMLCALALYGVIGMIFGFDHIILTHWQRLP